MELFQASEFGNYLRYTYCSWKTKFNKTYNENILVNAMAVGLQKDKYFIKAKGINKSVVYVGSKTGRDAYMGHQWLLLIDENSDEKNLLCKLAIHLLKNY